MITATNTAFSNTPPQWGEFNRLAPRHVLKVYGADTGKVNRFCAWYRLAKSFRGMEFDGFKESTSLGYNALMQLTLTWSAVEGLLDATGKGKNDFAHLSKMFDHAPICEQLRASDDGARFFGFVREHLNSKNRSLVDEYLAGKAISGLHLAQSVRHIFVHGPLTPSANQADPMSVKTICERLCTGLFKAMDGEFNTLVDALKEAHA